MMVDEFNINKETICQPSMKICRTGRSAQNSSHTDSWTSITSRDTHHDKASSRLVKTIPIFFIAYFLFPKVKTALKGKKFQDVEDIKKNMMSKLNIVPLEAFADSFQKL
jgi:hypothetical protein